MKKLLIALAFLLPLTTSAQTFKINTILTPVAPGFVYSDGVGTHNFTASTSPYLPTFFGAGITSCNSANNALQWSAGLFSCASISGGGSGSNTDKFATSTNSQTIYPNSAKAIVINETATTTNTNFEVNGTSTASQFAATNTNGTSTLGTLNLGGLFAPADRILTVQRKGAGINTEISLKDSAGTTVNTIGVDGFTTNDLLIAGTAAIRFYTGSSISGTTLPTNERFRLSTSAFAALTTGGASITSGNGVVNTPTYAFTGDLTTGFWRPAAGQVALSVNGVEAMRTTAGIFTGIGTTTPQWLLELATSTRPQLALSDGTLTSNHWTLRSVGNNLYFATASPATFATSSTAALSIDANGKVRANCFTNDGTTCITSSSGATTVTTAVPLPIQGKTGVANKSTNTNTTMYVGMVNFPAGITVNKLSVDINTVNTSGSIKLAMYSEDGQTLIIPSSTFSVTTGGLNTFTLGSPVTISPGNYYIAWVTVGTTDLLCRFWATNAAWDGNPLASVTSEPVVEGTVTVTAGTIPATINPASSISFVSESTQMFRFDN